MNAEPANRKDSSQLAALVHAGIKFPDGQTKILASMVSDSAGNVPMDAAPVETATDNN